MNRSYYSVATARYETISPRALLIGRAVRWLLARLGANGNWGGPDSLDEFVSTTHVLMALFAVGMSPDAPSVQPALRFLATIDKEKHLSFYWRSGVFLNLPAYRSLVVEDAEYIWANIGRVAVHRDYPIFFFLLKLIRFGDIESELSFKTADVIERILSDWRPGFGWYERTSITTMALSLIYDLEFDRKAEVLSDAQTFVLSKYEVGPTGGRFHTNIVDDAFSVFNVAERGYLATKLGRNLTKPIQTVARRLEREAIDQDHWQSGPPFGGSVGPEVYPTAVMIRALLALPSPRDLLEQVSGFLIDIGLQDQIDNHPQTSVPVHPFWGPASPDVEPDLCFVLMPFQPKKLGEIFERYVRKPIEHELGMRCVRADDIDRPAVIMRDVWEYINKARIIVADLTNRNANVFYELGMSHVLGKEVILITRAGTNIPFDLSGIRYISYEDSPGGYEELARRLVGSIRTLTGPRATVRGPR